MKLAGVLFLSVSAVVVSAGGSGGMMEDWQTFKHWTYMKAQESCWGEDNMKQYMVNMKKAVAKCHQVDAPELSLPPFRSTYRFINTMLNNAENMENQKMMFLYKMMEKMERYSDYNNDNYHHNTHSNNFEDMFESFSHNSDRHYNSFRPYNSGYENKNWMEKMMKKMMMKKMMNNMDMDMDHDSNRYSTYSNKFSGNSNFDESALMENMMRYKMKNMDQMDNTESNSYRARMAELLSRNKRQANNNNNKDSAATLPVSLDIGDRLADKLKAQQERMEQKIGNMTCVLREVGILNQQNELDERVQKNYMNKFAIKDKWLKDRVNDNIEECIKVAENLPSDYMQEYNYPGFVNMAKVKTYMKCLKYEKMKTCMYKDVKEKLEQNFGSLEKILEQTQLTEDQLYPLVMNLLHGDEMEYNF